jgi:hypothetical protein
MGKEPWNKNNGGYALSTKRIPVLQYDKEMNFIKEWDSAKTAGIELNISDKHISSCMTGKRKTTHGFIWKYKFNKKTA